MRKKASMEERLQKYLARCGLASRRKCEELILEGKIEVNGKEAITHFKVLNRFEKKYTLLEINIETGRTHQIRVHLSYIGFPIIGDDVYSNGKNKWNIVGQCLHAKSLDFLHPITGEKIHVEAELPKYFIDILEELKNEKEG